MHLAMVASAERYCELVTDLETDSPRLRKAQIVRIGWLPPAHQTRVRSDEFEMGLVAQALGLCDSELALIDLGRSQRRCRRRQGRRHRTVFRCVGLITAEEIGHRALVSAPVVMRRPRDRCRIIRM